MQKVVENMSVPKLRFGEFKDDLRRGAMKEFGYFYYGKSAPKHSLSEDAPTPCVRYGELYSKFGEYISEIHSYTNIDPKNLKFSKGGEVLIPRVGEDPLDFAYCSFLPFSNIAIGEMISVYNTEENGVFITYYINGTLKKPFARVVEGGNVSNLYFRYLENINLNLPSLPEQQKIAAFLSSVDEKLQQLNKKKSLLEDYKKGVMQKIFSQELRFKDQNGNNYPDWEEKKLGELFDFKQGVQCGVESQYFEKKDGLVRFIRIVDLTKDDEPIRYIEDPGTIHHITFNDLFMVRYGNAGYVGYGYEGVIANNLFRFIPANTMDIHNNYFHFVFKFKQRQFELLASSSTMPALNFTSLRTLKLRLPAIEEQQKIANFLSAINAKIDLVSTQIKNTQAFKKGLLQQMFV